MFRHKLFRRTLLAIAGLAMASGSLVSCDNELDVTAEPEDILVVYGVLNPKAERQYLRLSWAFLTDGNATEFAQSNELSLAEAEVTMTEVCYDGSGNPKDCSPARTINFAPMDTTLGEGEFNRNAVVWMTEDSILPGRTYVLRVAPADVPGYVVGSHTTVPDQPRIFDPRDSIAGEGDQQTRETLELNKDNVIDYQAADVPSGLGRPGVEGSAFEFSALLEYGIEQQNGDTVFQSPVRYGPIGPFAGDVSCSAGNSNCYRITGDAVIGVWDQKMADGERVYRTGDPLRQNVILEITAIDTFLYNYTRVNSPAVLDFTTVKPEYTNIDVREGEGSAVGVLGSINQEEQYILLDDCTEFLLGLNDTPQPPDCNAE
jgi:hypothetical protein